MTPAPGDPGAPGKRGRRLRVLSRVLALACAAVSLLVTFETARTVAANVASPLVYDRLGGCIVDHAIRIREGLPVYAEPDDRFVAVVYTPLYYVLSAGMMSVVGEGVLACRLTSALLVAGCVAVAVALVRLVTPRTGWALLAVALSAAGYPVCGFFYDAPRPDPASSLAALLALWAAARFRGLASAAAVGVLLGLAWFSKQSTLGFAGVFLLGWALFEWRRALLAGAVFALGTGAAAGLMTWATDGWFWTFCGYLTTQHELPLERLTRSLRRELLGDFLIPAGACLAAGAGLLALRRRGEAERGLRFVLLGTLAIAAMCLASRARVGSTVKVLMPLCFAAAAALPASFAWLEGLRGGAAWRHGVRALGLALATGYLLQHRFDPDEARVPDEALAEWAAFERDVEAYAARGQVWVGPWGHVTTRMEGQSMRPQKIALEDYLGIRGHSTGLPFPPKLKRAIRNRDFVAIFWTVEGGNEELNRLLLRHYAPTGVARGMTVGTRDREMDIVAWEPRGGR